MQYPDVIRLVTSVDNLTIKEIIRRCRVNKAFYQAICQSEQFWTLLARERFHIDTVSQDPQSIRDIQEELLTRERALDELTSDVDALAELPFEQLRQDLADVKNTDLVAEFISDDQAINREGRRRLYRYMQAGYDKLIARVASDHRVKEADFNRLLAPIAITAVNDDLLYELLTDPRYNMTGAIWLHDAATDYRPELLEYILNHPPKGWRWRRPRAADEEPRLTPLGDEMAWE